MKNTDAIIFLENSGRGKGVPDMQQNSPGHISEPSFLAGPKKCSKCNKTCPATAFRKSTWPGHKDGLKPTCRECERARDRARVKTRKLPAIPSTTDDKISPEYTPDQLDRATCRGLFDYEPRNGDLLWRSTGKRVLPNLTSMVARDGVMFPMVEVGGTFYRLHVLIWNWHRGRTDLAVVWKDGNRLHNRIQNLREAAAIEIWQDPNATERRHNRHATTKFNLAEPIRCPCCYQETWRPALDTAARIAGLQPMEKRILGAIWAGGGMPVDNERIFTAMYEDDPDGGPEPQKMYSALKTGLSYMRGRLKGTGVGVKSNGYGQGYCLVLGE